MAVSRYDQRKSLEERGANAIGTEYVRADLADAQTRDAIRQALLRYARLREGLFQTRDPQELASIDEVTAGVQLEL